MGLSLSTQPKPVRTPATCWPVLLRKRNAFPALAFLLCEDPSSLRPSSLGLALGPPSTEPGDAEREALSNEAVNRAVPNQSGTVKGPSDTAAILGRALATNIWGCKGRDVANTFHGTEESLCLGG